MRYFITGSRGFAAGFVIERLLQNPQNFVVGIDCLYPCASRKDPEGATAANYVFVKGNLNEKDLVAHLLATYKFDMIIHLASQTHVCTSFSTPYMYAQDNFMATMVLLESVKLMLPETRPRIILVSSDEALGESRLEGKAKGEDAPFASSNVYASTKAAQECLANAYKCSYKLDIIIVRPNNLLGHRQFGEKCIPRFVSLLKRDLPITLHGTGTQLRAFLHVDDFVSALEVIMAKGTWGDVYHIASEYEISILDLAERIADIMGKKDTYKIVYCEDRPFNDVRYHIQSDKLKALGWSQKVDLDTGLRRTIQWYLDGKDEDYFVEKFELPKLKEVSPVKDPQTERDKKRQKS